MEIINNTVFESDAEFEDFCVVLYVTMETGDTSYHGDYSELYKQYLADGKTFVTMDEDSVIYKRNGIVNKRIPVMMNGRFTGRTILVQLRIRNLEPWFDEMLMPEDLSPNERDAINKLINENPQITVSADC